MAVWEATGHRHAVIKTSACKGTCACLVRAGCQGPEQATSFPRNVLYLEIHSICIVTGCLLAAHTWLFADCCRTGAPGAAASACFGFRCAFASKMFRWTDFAYSLNMR